MNTETRTKQLEDGTVITQRVYWFQTGFQMWCPEKSCVFCKHCTDVWYDFHGPYMYLCLKEQDGIKNLTEKGHTGKCEYFDGYEDVDIINV